MTLRPALLATTAALPLLASAQFGDLIPRPKINIPSLAELTKGEAPLTSNILDVKFFGWPEFDKLDPTDFQIVGQDKRNDKFSYNLSPGHYKFEFKSFCAKGYTYGPTDGTGYAFNRWKGGKVGFLKQILAKYNAKPEVDQENVQLLIWAVLARVKPQDMKGGAREALIQLFGEKDGIKMMSEGALDFLADKASNELFGKVDRELRPFYEYDNKMRGLYNQANSTYADFERLAVLPAPKEVPKMMLTNKRWHLHPAGYMFRVSSIHYSKISMEVIVPRGLEVVKDNLKRITKMSAPGYSLEITYNDAVAPFKCPNDAKLTGYAVSKVVLTNDAGTETNTKPGWVFVGSPSKKKTLAFDFNSLFANTFSNGPQDGTFEGWGERYEQAGELRDRIETYEEWYERTQRIERGDEPTDDVFNTGHVQDMIESLFGGTEDRLGVIADTYGRLMEHLSHATHTLDGLPGGSNIDPGAGVHSPGASGHQNLISSSNTW